MRRDLQKGVTLLELLIAMGVFAVVMTSAFPLVDQIVSRFQMARDHYVAATICQARIERVRAVPYSDLHLFEEASALVDDYGNLSSPNGRFQRSTSVVTNSPAGGLTMMTVKTKICVCSHWGWRCRLHPLNEGKYVCCFTDECEEMKFIFTEYKK